MRRLLDRFFLLAGARPRAAAALVALVTLVLGAGLARLRPDFDVEQMFPLDDPERVYYSSYREDFGRDDATGLVAVRDRTGSPHGVFTPATLGAISRFAEAVRAWPEVKRVRSVVDARKPRARGDVVEVARLLPRIPPEGAPPAELLAAKAAFTEDPLFRESLVSLKGDATVIAVELHRDAADFAGRRVVLARLAPLLDDLAGDGAREVLVHGMPFARARYLEVVTRDQRRLFPASLVLLAAFLYASFGRARLVLAPFVVLAVSCAWVLGTLGWLGLHLNFLTQTAPVVIMTVGVTDLVHILLEEGPTVGALRRVGPACFMTCVTAAIGFLDLAFTNVTALVEFGIACAAGMLGTWVIEVLLLPALVPEGGGARPPGALARRGHAAIDRLLAGAASLVPRAAPAILVLTALAMALGLLAMTRLRIEARIYDYLDPEHEICRAERFFEAHLGAVLPLGVVIDSGRAGGALAPETVSAAAQVERFLSTIDGLHAPRSLGADLATAYRAFEGSDPPPEGISPAAAAQCFLLYESAPEHPVHRLLDFERRRTQVVARIDDVGTARTFEVRDRIERYLDAEIRPRFPGTRFTGIAYVAQRGNHALARHLAWGFAASFVVTFAVLWALFRSASVAALAMVPNVLPIVLVFGALGALGMPLKATMAMTCSIAFGIAVDDTIHYLARVEEGIHAGLVPEEAAREAIRSSGRGMVLSTLVLGLGFLVFALSEFEGNRLFGYLTAGTLLIGMGAELLVTPALVAWARPRWRAKGAADAPAA